MITTKKMPNPIKDHIVDEIIRLYDTEKLPATTVAMKTGVSCGVVYRYLHKHKVIRGHSDAHSVHTYHHNKIGRVYGTNGWWQSSKTGRWESADSKLELVRMHQLDSDPEVKTWQREGITVPLPNGKRYTPDFLVTMRDGRLVVEEVKAKSMMFSGSNPLKYQTAEKYFREQGIDYKIVTEDEIGISAIREFKIAGIMGLNQSEKEERRKARNRELAHKNRMLHPERKKAYEAANAEKISQRQKEYRLKNRDAILAKKKEAFRKFKEEQPEKYAELLLENNTRRNKQMSEIRYIASVLVVSGLFVQMFGQPKIKMALTKKEIQERYRAKKQAKKHQSAF